MEEIIQVEETTSTKTALDTSPSPLRNRKEASKTGPYWAKKG